MNELSFFGQVADLFSDAVEECPVPFSFSVTLIYMHMLFKQLDALSW